MNIHVGPCLVHNVKKISHKDECMHRVLNEFICEIFSQMSVIFRDESNESSFIIIGYMDATVTITVPNHPLII